MLKKISIGVAVLFVIIVAVLFWLNNRNRTLSPRGQVELTSGDLTVSIPYSRPSVRGRRIFGTQAQEALQPYGVYWRLGANESTEVTFSRDVIFNDKPIKKGTYKIYAIPGPESFEIKLNSELGKWGYLEPDYSKDVTSTMVPVMTMESSVEQYTIRMEPIEKGIAMIFEFSTVRLPYL